MSSTQQYREQSKEKLVIFDTTLRDGEQSPGASMTKDEKIRIAKALEKMRVDVIEAGFAISSQGDFEAVQAIANTITESRICSLSRAVRGDIERAAEALKGANAGRIHTFIATSPIHMKHKLVLHMDWRGGNKGVNAPSIGTFKCLGGALNIAADCSGQATNSAFSNSIGNGLNRLEISLTGDSKTRLDHIDTHFLKGLGNTNFLVFGHGCARALFAIAQCSIKDH